MDLGLNIAEGKVLHGLLEEASGDIVIKLDQSGFIVHASGNIAQLGHDLTAQLLMPHVADLSEADHSDLVAAYADQILSGQLHRGDAGSVEFPVIACSGEEDGIPVRCRRWYTLSLRPIFGDCSAQAAGWQNLGDDCEQASASGSAREIRGAVGLLRSVQHLRLLEGELHSRSVTDALTGLANRHAFCANMRRQLANGASRVVIVLSVDRMRAMSLQYGQRTADEIQWGFAKFLETMIQPGFELAQLDNEKFAVMARDVSMAQARAWADDVLDTFNSIALASSARAPRLSASAGLARLENSVDWTLRQAELALVIAQAGGGRQVGRCGYNSPAPNRAALGLSAPQIG